MLLLSLLSLSCVAMLYMQFGRTRLMFLNQSALDLTSVEADICHLFDIDFQPVLINHIVNLCSSKTCQARLIISYKIDFEALTAGKDVEWVSVKNDDGGKLIHKTSLMYASSTVFRACMFVRVVSFVAPHPRVYGEQHIEM